MKTKRKELILLTATFIFTALVMGLIIYGLGKENDNMRKKIDRLEYVLRECAEKQTVYLFTLENVLRECEEKQYN